MASYQILAWGDIPAGVKARDEEGDVRETLPIRFQHAIDAVATATGRTETEAYLADWTWSDPIERAGPAAEVAPAVARELDGKYPSGVLTDLKAEMIERLGRPTDHPHKSARTGPVNTEATT